MDKELLISSIRSIPDFPKKGILFRDVTTLFNNADAFREAVDAIYELYKDKGITKVAGLESRWTSLSMPTELISMPILHSVSSPSLPVSDLT